MIGRTTLNTEHENGGAMACQPRRRSQPNYSKRPDCHPGLSIHSVPALCTVLVTVVKPLEGDNRTVMHATWRRYLR